MNINIETQIGDILDAYPEAEEFLYLFKPALHRGLSILSLAEKYVASASAIVSGLERVIKKVDESPCDYPHMRARLIKEDCINVAGFVDFVWHHEFIEELHRFALLNNITLNLNIFSKYEKKAFQHYLAVCDCAEDLPDILIGKGFSSLMTQRFIKKFIDSNAYCCDLSAYQHNPMFQQAGLYDVNNNFHPFAIEEQLIVYDSSIALATQLPTSLEALTDAKYKQLVTQMGKANSQHESFTSMCYLYQSLGAEGIKAYVRNLKSRQHFSQIAKDIGRKKLTATPINVMRHYAYNMIRSDAKAQLKVIAPRAGNPVVALFFMVKQQSNAEVLKVAKHLYSQEIANIIAKSGALHAACVAEPAKKVRWIGWETVKNLNLPYVKESLSEMAS